MLEILNKIYLFILFCIKDLSGIHFEEKEKERVGEESKVYMKMV